MRFASILRSWHKMIQLPLNKTGPHFQILLCLRLTSPNYAFMRYRLYSKRKVKEHGAHDLVMVDSCAM